MTKGLLVRAVKQMGEVIKGVAVVQARPGELGQIVCDDDDGEFYTVWWAATGCGSGCAPEELQFVPPEEMAAAVVEIARVEKQLEERVAEARAAERRRTGYAN